MSLLKTSAVNFENEWRDMQLPLASLITGAPQTLTNDKWLKMYSAIYKICTNPGAPQAEMLFFRLRGLLVKHVEKLLRKLDTIDGDPEFLALYCTSFEAFTTGTSYISELFRYLNRYWISYSHCKTGQAPVPGVYPVTELSLHIWHDVAFVKLRKRLITAILHIYHSARLDKSDCFEYGDCIASTVQTYYSLGLCKQDQLSLYREELELPFLENVAEFYTAKALELLSRMTISEYLQETELLCTQEQNRCDLRLHRTTVIQVRQACCRVLIDEHADRICEDAETFLINNQKNDLHRMFALFSELVTERALISLKNILKKYIERSGREVVQTFQQDETTKNPEGYIEALVQIRNKYFELIKDAFGYHPLMRTALDQACRAFANSHPRLPELLAKYTHYLMSRDKKYGCSRALILPGSTRSVSTPLSDDMLEQRIENISVVFCLIDDKDIFKKYYSKFLAKRLIKGTSASNEMEILLIQKLRDICGCDFVSKLQKMMKDKMLSKELVNSFTGWLDGKSIELCSDCAANTSAINFHHTIVYHCDVLTAGAWPISCATSEHKLNLPPSMRAHTNLFTQFYTERSTGRKLLWVHNLSFGMVQSHCFKKRYEFLLSFFQMVILLQFNTATKLKLSDIVQLTNISEKDCIHHLASLVKAKILTSDGDNVSPSLALNFDFYSRKLRVSAVPSSPGESPKEFKAPIREVEEDRKMSLQAAIVRVLKTRRDIDQTQLIQEVAAMLVHQFVPTSSAIKQNVEILIQKEYLRRLESDQTRILYVA
ncbi:cullin family [Plasmopara halstedii]|uniref:Cullin-5 n=1 Tax=Plasmopara halstedii TaxID=4781 RepID=A0A0P1AM02_PLAHL|nr:cullin family [Plasmopara halstedii]CEG42172.1 cullin family [Plasmopara halstedii]|eukprot:XP_024578541.1 cullin family [Plasmopara halstedii]